MKKKYIEKKLKRNTTNKIGIRFISTINNMKWSNSLVLNADEIILEDNYLLITEYDKKVHYNNIKTFVNTVDMYS